MNVSQMPGYASRHGLKWPLPPQAAAELKGLPYAALIDAELGDVVAWHRKHHRTVRFDPTERLALSITVQLPGKRLGLFPEQFTRLVARHMATLVDCPPDQIATTRLSIDHNVEGVDGGGFMEAVLVPVPKWQP